MSKWEPKTYVLKNGQTLLLREAVPDDAPRVLAYLNRVGGESDNLLFGKDGFPMPVERERAFLESQRKEEKSIMLAGFVGEELVAIASCDALTARERVAHRAGLSVTVGRGFWGLHWTEGHGDPDFLCQRRGFRGAPAGGALRQ